MKTKHILSSLIASLFILSACDSDRDSNPTYQDPTTFVLNVPAYVNNTYDLENSSSIELTCSQADYGYTAPATYTVQVSTDESFATFEELSTKYTTAKMDVSASEIAVAATKMEVAKGVQESSFPLVSTLYVRLKSEVSEGIGTILSNSITLPKVKLYFALPAVKLPTKMLMIGDFCNWSWDNAPEMIPFHDGTTGAFWRLVYIPEATGVKFNTAASWNGSQFGATATIVDNYESGAAGTDNIDIKKGGWYLVVVRSAVNGRDINYTVEFNEPAVYLFGPANGGAWEKKDEWKFEVPTTADGSFVSPAFAASVPSSSDSGVRACVVVEGYDWWKSEFMVFDGKLEYRADGGDQSRVGGDAGQKLYINFTAGTGEIK